MATPNPVKPSEIAAVVPSPSADICQKIKLIFLQFPALISEFWLWAFNESGTFTEDFKDAASQWTAGDFKHSAVQTQDGWLLCNGQEVSRTTYARLFAVIGTTYGTGDGSTTFTLPDFQDRVLLGVSGTKGLGWEDGVETVTLTTAQIPSHTHTIAANLYGVIPAGVIDSKPHAAGPQTSGATGGGQSHTNMQPSAAAYILVKT